jgi:Mg-chelatase subunit ChlD
MKFDLKNSPRHIQRLKNIANVISGIPGVDVYISSQVKGPYFQPSSNLIVLPNGDYSEEKFVNLIEGFICHEAGHGRYTDNVQWQCELDTILTSAPGFVEFDNNHEGVFDSLPLKKAAYAKARRLGGLINLFDDIQMERHVAADYAQAGPRLAKTYELMVEAGFMTCDIGSASPDPVRFLESFLLNTLRIEVLNQEGNAAVLDPFFEYANTLLEPIKSEIMNITHAAHNSSCTQDAIHLAKETLALIERMRDEAKEQQKEKDKSPDADNSDSQQEPGTESDNDAGDNGHQDSEENEDEHSDKCEGEMDEGSDEAGRDDSQAVTGETEESNFSSEQWEKLESLLSEFLECAEDSPDYHEHIAAMIEEIAEACPADVKAEFGGSDWDLPDLPIDIDVYNEALRLSQTVSGDLAMLQQANVRNLNKTRDRGVSFDPGRLIQAPMGVRDVFRTPGTSKSRGHIGIVLVRDISGSMQSEDRYIHAIKADLALSLALQSYSNMHVSNILFPYRDKTSEIIKSFDQTVEETISRFSLGKTGGNTPTGDALMAAHNLLLESQFDRKIILLITDGEPSVTAYSVKDVLSLADSNGIEIAGIGINTSELEGFNEGTFVNVEDISKLAVEVNRLVMSVLTN